jgi:hypothetical protein
LLFEMDNRLYSNNSIGYGWTNTILAAACVPALAWLLRELFDSVWYSAVGALLLASWTGAFPIPVDALMWPVALPTLAVGVWRHRRKVGSYLPAFFMVLFLGQVLPPIEPLGLMINWLPARTASSMALCALVAMAAYARYERLGPQRFKVKAPTALDIPATRTTLEDQPARIRWHWVLIAAIFTVLSLACYEQAVMLPACLFGVAVLMRVRGYRPAWWLQAIFWLLLGGYLVVRHQVIPPGLSGYQKQQLRSSLAGAYHALQPFIFPPLSSVDFLKEQYEMGWTILLNDQIWRELLFIATHCVGFYLLRQRWKPALAGWAWGFLAFLPMAFLKIFNHYSFWPLALRTPFVCAALVVCGVELAIAWSPPTLQAPLRPSPAPGSLPRP